MARKVILRQTIEAKVGSAGVVYDPPLVIEIVVWEENGAYRLGWEHQGRQDSRALTERETAMLERALRGNAVEEAVVEAISKNDGLREFGERLLQGRIE